MQGEHEDAVFVDRRETDRRTESRRRYNRRQGDAPVAPPYFVIFERIAVALEKIARVLGEPPTAQTQPEDET
ncbi:MAG TPA: hypothetical protein VHE56_02025 [Mycobacteriales bacterium]|nr:hypothetical protein [Mycobacteriales bacterium]